MIKIIWAQGEQEDADTPKWRDILAKVTELRGRQETRGNRTGVLCFPSEVERDMFARWYASVAPSCLQVRTAVVEAVATANVCMKCGKPKGMHAEGHPELCPTNPCVSVYTPPDTVAIPVPPGIRTLKELRMWHWRKVLEWRKYATDWEARIQRDGPNGKMRAQVDNCRQHANLHLCAVQVLNDCLPGTVERDCAEADRG